jgi:hypothetical protein
MLHPPHAITDDSKPFSLNPKRWRLKGSVRSTGRLMKAKQQNAPLILRQPLGRSQAFLLRTTAMDLITQDSGKDLHWFVFDLVRTIIVGIGETSSTWLERLLKSNK